MGFNSGFKGLKNLNDPCRPQCVKFFALLGLYAASFGKCLATLGTNFLLLSREVGKLLPVRAASQPRNQKTWTAQRKKLEILHNCMQFWCRSVTGVAEWIWNELTLQRLHIILRNSVSVLATILQFSCHFLLCYHSCWWVYFYCEILLCTHWGAKKDTRVP